jgi:hypothetical protein
MATSSSSLCAAPYRGSLSDLSSELLALILEQVSSTISGSDTFGGSLGADYGNEATKHGQDIGCVGEMLV